MGNTNPYATRLNEFPSTIFGDPAKCTKGDWRNYFQRRMGNFPTALILELGSSNAAFLCSIAKANPDKAFLGIDWKYKITYKGAQRIDREKLTNIALLRGRAQDWITAFEECELDEIWAFFPDPWAKKAQLKNRLLQEPFLLQALSRLKPGGCLVIKTDHPGYFQWMLAMMGAPQPELPDYRPAAEAAAGEKSRRAKQVRMRAPASEDLPAPSAKLRSACQLRFSSADYWAGRRPPTLFSESQTLFEGQFVKEKLPIYYLELEKTQPGLPFGNPGFVEREE